LNGIERVPGEERERERCQRTEQDSRECSGFSPKGNRLGRYPEQKSTPLWVGAGG
jgi:hypothetical protein